MKAFFLLVVLVGAAVAEEAVKVEEKPVTVVAKMEDKMAPVVAKVEGEGVELGSRTGAVDVGERSAVPAAPIYPTPYPSYYWPYYVPLAAPSQLARSDSKGAVATVPYYYPYAYTYPYYTYPYAPVVAAAPVPALRVLPAWKK
ncbi:uncharacterized protein LOC126272050 [Schistocerca gregaria]|uniref:uncharacterized protein LOC126272050 n=1 Tax=Schistocerca gregaria TaxID=7010 RepID=UPI00211F424C|nr:uncharacterized protein LOC126272050 [Schistocerca gregaria]